MRFEESIKRTAALASIALAVMGTSSAAAASVLNVRDEGHLHLLSSEGSELVDEGEAAGTLPGKVRVRFVYNGDPQVTAQFTIYGHSGSISGRAKARLNNPTSPEPSLRGAFSITGGSGRYAHIHGTGELFGVFIRRGKNKYGLIVQAIGKFDY
jgi:hypothetical protein